MKTKLIALVFLFGCALIPGGFGADGARPNILFIMTDQQFGDAMSCRIGNRFINTPAMDSLARSGTIFTRAYAANPICMPSRAALFTGRYPHEVGVTKNGAARIDASKFACMGTYFRKAGYEVAYTGKWHLAFGQQDLSSHGFRFLKNGEGSDRDARTAGAAVKFFSEKPDQPFLLVASFLNPHDVCQFARSEPLPTGPIGEPPVVESAWPPAPPNLAPPTDEADAMRLMRRAYHAAPMFPVGEFRANDWRKLRWAYYRMIEKVDREIDRVLSALRQAGLESQTLIVFTSDHGECAGAHGFNQKTVFYEESVRVPLIVNWKGRTHPKSTDLLVNTGIDILPTMLDCAGLDIPNELPGRSLLRIAMGEESGPWRDHVVIENHLAQAGVVDGFQPEVQGRMVRSERFKYCVYDKGIHRESLVDLVEDPGELKNLARSPNYRDEILRHRKLLEQFGRSHNDALVRKLLPSGPAGIAERPEGE